MINRRSLPSAGRLKLALLMVLIGLLNLAPSQDDCCYNEDQGDKDPNVIEYRIIVSPSEVTIESGKKATVSVIGSATVKDGGSASIVDALPWAVVKGSQIEAAVVSPESSANATLQVFARAFTFEDFFFLGGETYSTVYASRGKRKSQGGYLTIKLLGTTNPTVELTSIEPHLKAGRLSSIPGGCPPGVKCVGEVIIGNSGKDDLIITAFSFSGGDPGFSISGNVLPIRLSSRSVILIRPLYAGTTSGAKTTLIIQSNSPGRNFVPVELVAP